MNFKKPFLAITLFAMLGATSGCEVIEPEQEAIAPAMDEMAITPVAPPAPDSGGGRGGGGGGAWGG